MILALRAKYISFDNLVNFNFFHVKTDQNQIFDLSRTSRAALPTEAFIKASLNHYL